MKKNLLFFSLVSVLAVSFTLAGEGRKKPVYEALPNETQPVDPNATFTPAPEPDWSRMRPTVGTFTTLSGFYDYQSNGGAIQHIRVNAANGNIHVVYMTSPDSTAAGLNLARRVAYAFSSDGGTTWADTVVPNTRSGFPTIDLLRGPSAGLPVISSHPDGAPTIAKLFVDSPEGAREFVELGPPPVFGTGLEPIWPYVASASDGSMILAASQNTTVTTGVAHHNRMQSDFLTWNSTWDTWSGDVQSGGRNPVQANNSGRVGILWNTSNGTAVLGNRWRESTDNGVNWSAPVNLYSTRTAGADTFNSYVHCDFIYDGDNPLYVFSEYYAPVDRNDNNIVFWSQATGFTIAVPHDTTKYGPYSTIPPNPQRFHNMLMNFPSIGMSGSTIVVAYQAFQPEVDGYGFNYSDLWYVASSNGGSTWGSPQRITNTPTTDERYPSVSKWNAPGQFNIVWSEKAPGHSGLFAFPGPDGAAGVDTVRTSQVFLRVSPIQFTTSVGDGGSGTVSSFTLEQNYPNPFNPATTINYTVPKGTHVRLVVYNALGQEVATLADGYRNAGSYAAEFSAAKLASGVYFYTLKAGEFSSTRKMVLMK